MATTHSLHIPVMGTAFTIDTPLKVGKFGISSVVSFSYAANAITASTNALGCSICGE